MPLHKHLPWFHPRTAVVAHDLLMAGLAWWAIKTFRYAMLSDGLLHFHVLEIAIVLLIQGLVFYYTGLYKGLWRFASLHDLWNILKASIIGSVLIFLALFLYQRLDGVPRSVSLIYPLLLTVLLGAPRLAYRHWKNSRFGIAEPTPYLRPQRVLVIGANQAGESLSRELRRDPHYTVVGFVDERAHLRGASINGLLVLGRLGNLPELARETALDLLLIAQPDASGAQMRHIVTLCEDTGLPYRTIPKLEDVIAGRAQVSQLQEVVIEDLLGREPVTLDFDSIRKQLSGRCVLVTGGGGSIGSELCRQVARTGAQTLIVVDHSEYNLYRIEYELRKTYPDLVFEGILADAGDPVAMRQLFARVKPQRVFHAAAYKHVPMLQGQLRTAVRNNVLVTRNVADLADEFGVETFLLVSTDKVVNPTSVMGACKRMAEIYCQNLDSHSKTLYITVRFGNVLDSAGSVVPLFREQIRQGGPVTVTHPDITRYFMTIPEACQLILQAATLGKGGEIFALDMGEPVKIRDLAEQMIRLTGKKPGIDIGIVYTGLREGEKLFEELFHPQENYCATRHTKIFLAQPRSVAWDHLQTTLTRARDAVQRFDEETLRQCVSTLLPAFHWSDNAPREGDNVVQLRRQESHGDKLK